MATENAVIVIAQAETGHTEVTPVEGEHTEGLTAGRRARRTSSMPSAACPSSTRRSSPT